MKHDHFTDAFPAIITGVQEFHHNGRTGYEINAWCLPDSGICRRPFFLNKIPDLKSGRHDPEDQATWSTI